MRFLGRNTQNRFYKFSHGTVGDFLSIFPDRCLACKIEAFNPKIDLDTRLPPTRSPVIVKQNTVRTYYDTLSIMICAPVGNEYIL